MWAWARVPQRKCHWMSFWSGGAVWVFGNECARFAFTKCVCVYGNWCLLSHLFHNNPSNWSTSILSFSTYMSLYDYTNAVTCLVFFFFCFAHAFGMGRFARIHAIQLIGLAEIMWLIFWPFFIPKIVCSEWFFFSHHLCQNEKQREKKN